MEFVQKFKFMKPTKVRTRFAPSPTGFLHIGSARTALFNYIFAKKHNGTFVLRIEDTDVQRSKPIFEKDIIESLKWLGLDWDEGPQDNDRGLFGPYKQSQRGEIYEKYLKKLLQENKAYYCFCTPEELNLRKQELMSRGLPPIYNGKCSTLSKEDIKRNIAEGKKYIIRFKTPKKIVKFNDLIRGEIKFDTGLIGDFSIAKDLTLPLYNFAVVVDDFEMKISHVIRGEDLLPNTPKQILLQEALGFPKIKYAHLPLILGPDRTKLSKRHGAVSLSEYKKEGYLPEALINFLAFLGWNPGTEREIYSLSSLIKEFSFERVQKSGAIFNIKKLDFLNSFYIREKTPEKITKLCLPYLLKSGLLKEMHLNRFLITETNEEVDFDFLKKIVSLFQERMKKLSEISELSDFFFKERIIYPKSLLKWKEMTDEEIKEALYILIKILSNIKKEKWQTENLKEKLITEAEKFGNQIKGVGDRGFLLWPFRVALTGREMSPPPFEIAEIFGKEKTLKRINEAIKLLEQ